MLVNLAVVLHMPKFSENVGSVARAMANMGCADLVLVAPQDFDPGRARALATAKGHDILERMRVADGLAQALAPFATVIGTTARTGGWRKDLASPEAAAGLAARIMARGERVALVFGPEDKGLTNDETMLCGHLVTIPTARAATSLNLAQAALVMLYEMFKACGDAPQASAPDPEQRPASHQEREALYATLRQALTAIDFIKDDNPDYWMLPVRALVERMDLRRDEFNLLMGVCRQLKWAGGKGRGQGS